jgi:hypothetical protein
LEAEQDVDKLQDAGSSSSSSSSSGSAASGVLGSSTQVKLEQMRGITWMPHPSQTHMLDSKHGI